MAWSFENLPMAQANEGESMTWKFIVLCAGTIILWFFVTWPLPKKDDHGDYRDWIA